LFECLPIQPTKPFQFFSGRFREGSEKVPGRFREGSGKVPGRFREGSGKVPGRFQEGSRKVPSHIPTDKLAQNLPEKN